MNDNVVKFRQPEKKKPEPPVKKRSGPMPGWVPFAGLIALALIIYAVQNAGLLGG